MKKVLLTLIIIALCSLNVQAKSIQKEFADIIADSGIRKESISVSFRDAKNGNIVYALNSKILMNPASVQKILTMPAAAQTLGKDYKFKTELYTRDDESYLIKLSGDPYLRYSDLKDLTKSVKRTTQNIYIDDSILDKKYWGEGWQWDDDMNTLMPKFGAYNLDKNLIKLQIVPSETGGFATILNPSKYPLVFMNTITSSNKTALDIKRELTAANNVLTLSGTVARQTTAYVPSNDIKRYFEIQLTRALGENRVYLKNPFVVQKKSDKDKFEKSIEHELSFALNDILKNSNNMSAETVFKLAGGKYKGENGTDIAGIEMFNDFCKKNNIDSSEIKIVDGSGVSKNNLVNADFISNFLYKNKDNDVMKYLPKPGEGTLEQRLLPLKDFLTAKTGTLSGISSLAGYLKTKSGKEYTFCIIQNDVKLSPSEKKRLEDYIVREAYLKL